MSDDSDSFRAAQSTHAARIQFLRNLQETTGKSYGELRKVLVEEQKAIGLRGQSQTGTVTGEERPPPPKLESSTVDLPKQTTLTGVAGPGGAGAGVAGAPTPPLIPVEVSGNFNGAEATGIAAFFSTPTPI